MPVMTLLFRNYYAALPHELFQAARVDGGGFWRIFLQLMVPMSTPIIVVAIIMQVTGIWNDFILGLVFAGHEEPADDSTTEQYHQHHDRRAALQRQHGGDHSHVHGAACHLLRFGSLVRARHCFRCGQGLVQGSFMSTVMSNVSIRDLEIQLGANTIIESLDLEVEPGEFLVLLGPSGCGKSTLLHSIAGLIDVSGGSIEIGGQDMTWADPKDRGIALVFQSYALYPTMNVERNLSFGLRIAGTPKAEIERRVTRAAEMLQLGPLLKRRPAQLSGGQRQRVAIGRAIVREADVFLFDEPLSNLDAKLRTELRRELKQLHKRLGATMIYVTHDQVEAMTLATRMAVMRGGVIQQIGTPAEVYAHPNNLFVATFLGSPGMNLLEGRAASRGWRSAVSQ